MVMVGKRKSHRSYSVFGYLEVSKRMKKKGDGVAASHVPSM